MIFRLTNIALSVLMLATTTGFSISQHFCHDRLASVSLFLPASGCGEEMTENCCPGEKPSHCQNAVSEHDCCENVNDFVKFSQQFTPEKNISIIAASAFIPATSSIFQFFSADYSFRIFINSPALPRDIPVLLHSFLL